MVHTKTLARTGVIQEYCIPRCRLIKDDVGADGKVSSSTKKKLKMLESELEIKTTALREAEAQVRFAKIIANQLLALLTSG